MEQREARLIVEEEKEETAPNEQLLAHHQKTKRVASLDIFRGLTVAVMILVDDAGGEWPMISHAPWTGCNLADFVMPFFLFIVGMAIALALKRIPDRLVSIKKVIIRTIKLVFWGLILQGGYSHAPDKLTYGVDMKHIRWFGILQRIALVYVVVSLLEITTKNAQTKDIAPGGWSIYTLYSWHWIAGACILAVYFSVLYGTYVPDWKYTVHNKDSPDYGKDFIVICGVRGRLDPPCNAVGYVDREVLGINHIYQRPAWKRSKACTDRSPYEGPFRKDAPLWCQGPFEPEGLLSSIAAILTTIIGVHFGHVLIHMKGHLDRLKHWLGMGLSLLTLGLVLHFTNGIPLNKQLCSFSYVCLTAGAAGLVFSTLYVLVDIFGLGYLFLPLEWIGMNAMLVFVLAAEGIFAGFINGWYYEDPHNTLIYWIKKHVFIGLWHSRKVGILLYVIFAEILFWGLVAGVLHQFGIYWKL
ncbi:heparan-alpha-glucosaminide N-acetyltransferase-like [Papaver somniferum]|uniref:heparan-alpha-glucosaminide N-acetyltransferase-like n=1 Tax=Papaver somniferum TaxID=3469 RepID=UPI000E6F8FB4|nr:heparan-alpha-glucosaminide N-acetyltransferase-like [Papaver somniferum]